MAGKRPVYRLVIGKRQVGTLWTAQSKDGKTNYHSGDIDVSALKEAVKEKGTKSKKIRISKDGQTEDHDTIRVAMFDAQRSGQQQSQSQSGGSW